MISRRAALDVPRLSSPRHVTTTWVRSDWAAATTAPIPPSPKGGGRVRRPGACPLWASRALCRSMREPQQRRAGGVAHGWRAALRQASGSSPRSAVRGLGVAMSPCGSRKLRARCGSPATSGVGTMVRGERRPRSAQATSAGSSPATSGPRQARNSAIARSTRPTLCWKIRSAIRLLAFLQQRAETCRRAVENRRSPNARGFVDLTIVGIPNASRAAQPAARLTPSIAM